MKIFKEEDLQRMTNEEITTAFKELTEEKERRKKIDKRVATLNFREALHKFIEAGANCDFWTTVSLTTSDVDVQFEWDSNAREADVELVEFDPFNGEVLYAILDELTRKIGNYEG